MFETQVPMALKAVKVKLDPNDGAPIRLCTLTLACEFDLLVAGGLGGDAREALASLKSGGMTRCELPIDALLVEAKLVAEGKSIVLKNLKGTKATARAGSEEKPPHIDLEFAFLFEREAWAFFGEHVGALALVTMNRMQMELLRSVEPAKSKRTVQ